jgi:adenosylhomocysteine nucleosidase
MSGKILILTAIGEELDKARAPEGVEVIYTGVGKVNAASAATLALLVLRPSLVINYGTAGKISKKVDGLVEVAHVVQRDIMAMPLAPRGRTPFSPELDRFSSGYGEVICGTGDSFVTASDPWLNENNIDIVDMELFAIAHACARQSVPWRAFKFITDEANDLAHEHWTENIAKGQDLFWEAVKTISENLDSASSGAVPSTDALQ